MIACLSWDSAGSEVRQEVTDGHAELPPRLFALGRLHGVLVEVAELCVVVVRRDERRELLDEVGEDHVVEPAKEDMSRAAQRQGECRRAVD